MKRINKHPYMAINFCLGLLGIFLLVLSPILHLHSEFNSILLASFIVFVISVNFMQKAINVFDISRITIPSFWYITYLFMIYFPAFIVFYRLEEPTKYMYLFAVQSVIVTIPLGIWLASTISCFDKKKIDAYFVAPVQEVRPGISKVIIYTILIGFAIYFALQYLFSLETIPLFYMLFNSHATSQELLLLREHSFKELDPRWATEASSHLFYIYLFLRTLIFPFLIMVSLGYYIVSRELKWLFLSFITLTVGVIYAASSIARAPVAAIFLRLSFAYYIIKQGRLGKKMVVALSILVILFPLMVTKMGYGDNTGMIESIKRVAIRICYTPAADLHDYFEIFPEHHDYLYGQALFKPILILLGLPNFYIENYVYRYKYPTNVETGHANAAFQSNLHADFGVWGVLIGGVLTGCLMQGIQIFIFTRRKTIINIAVYSFFVYAFWVLNMGSITSVLFVNGVVPLFVIIACLSGLETVINGAAKKG